MWKEHPLPSPSEVARIEAPLWRFMIPFVIYNPNPLPPPSCRVLALNCTPSSNKFRTFADEIPTPLSVTVMITDRPSALVLVSDDDDDVYLNKLHEMCYKIYSLHE
jgi:wyosine [tRNA(Phe)-imidazoG37] synthetase (radical SAM superfamily)